MSTLQPVLSVIVPVYNEAVGLRSFHTALIAVLEHMQRTYEVVYVDDGSTDDSARIIRTLAEKHSSIRLVKLSRNFGKELATTAGLHGARGRASILIDADGQHPVEAIPAFLRAWDEGALVVVGVRHGRDASFVKRMGSGVFYRLFAYLTGIRMDPNTSDFRLIDQSVRAEFNRLTEHNRITRGLIDWLGYAQTQIPYTEHPRKLGQSPYSFRKLSKLAVDSIISHSSSPLFIVAYIGAFVLPVSSILGLGMLIDAMLSDPLRLHATGGAYVIVLMLFLVGVLLVSQGIIGLYLSHIYAETQNRPLYIIEQAADGSISG